VPFVFTAVALVLNVLKIQGKKMQGFMSRLFLLALAFGISFLCGWRKVHGQGSIHAQVPVRSPVQGFSKIVASENENPAQVAGKRGAALYESR